jgi:hypothetical protein
MTANCLARMTTRVTICASLLTFATAILPFIVAQPLSAQDETTLSIDHTGPGTRGASTVSASAFHIKLAATDAVRSHPVSRVQGATSKVPRAVAAPQAAAGVALSSVPPPGFYPDDLTYFGGPTLTQMESNNIYVNKQSCGSIRTCWGNPSRFLRDLNRSTFIRLTDQYTGTRGSYEVGDSVSARVTPVPTLLGTQTTQDITQDQIVALVHDAASEIGTGYGHEYHVFLPAGIDTCFPGNQVCYSPDSPSTFFFCAYHGSIDFTDIGHVLVSVEPYQNVTGCQAVPPNPNGALADSTNSVLSHELIESITDPDPGSGWVAVNSLIALGAEIGDLCEPVGLSCLNNVYFCDSNVSLNNHSYEIQLEYSNTYHACAAGP